MNKPGRSGPAGVLSLLFVIDAAACAFFISEEASYITGQILGVNGGRNT